MSFLEWNEAAIVNHPSMDKEHKQMLDDTNKLYYYVTSNKTKDANELLKKIVEDLKGHFEKEENLMKGSKIPQYISHKLEHDRFYNKIRTLLSRIDSGKEILSIAHLKVVKVWFYNHIEFKDRNLANYLNEHNIE